MSDGAPLIGPGLARRPVQGTEGTPNFAALAARPTPRELADARRLSRLRLTRAARGSGVCHPDDRFDSGAPRDPHPGATLDPIDSGTPRRTNHGPAATRIPRISL